MTEEPQETVSVDFTIGIGDGKFTATAVVPAGQTNLTQILPVIQALDDSLIAGVGAQLAEAGRMIIPVGSPDSQQLQLIRMENGQPRITLRELCRFVPLISENGLSS